ncbi:MAG: hypothetical protein AAB225_14995 [Acidobacteriota bacterium]
MPDNHNARFERIEASLAASAAAGQRTDERLDRLTERHEALAQTVEITAGMQRANEERIARLLLIVESHERRLDDLES